MQAVRGAAATTGRRSSMAGLSGSGYPQRLSDSEGQEHISPAPYVAYRPPRARTIRYTTWLIVAGKKPWWPARLFTLCIMTLITANVVLAIVDQDQNIDTSSGTPFAKFYFPFEVASVVLFGTEYLLRLWCCVEAPKHKGRLRWMLRPLAIIDLVSIIPYIVDLATPGDNPPRGVKLIQVFRTFSLLRMERTFKSFRRIGNVLTSKGEELLVALFIGMILMITSSSLMYYLENPDGLGPDSGNQFTSIFAAMWWSVAALTTTGYGDLTPKTSLGKLLGGLLGFVGIGFFALPAGIIGSGFVECMMEDKQRRMKERWLDENPSSPMPPHLLRESLDTSRDASPRETIACASGSLNGAVQSSLRPPVLPFSPGDLEQSAEERKALKRALEALQAGEAALAASIVEERLRAIDAGGSA